MTAKKDLKRRVRERQARTGESYAAARAQVVAQRDAAPPAEPAPPAPEPVISVDEVVDLTEEAAQIGIKCGVGMSSRLAGRVDVKAMLLRLRDALLATEDDAALRVLRAAVLRGERPLVAETSRDWMHQARRFVSRALAGIGGVSEHGRMLAMHLDGTNGRPGVMAIFHLWVRPFGSIEAPRLMISAPMPLGEGTDATWTFLR